MLAPDLYDSPIGEGLREGLRKLGCIEGENIVIERRRSPVTTQGLRSSKFIAEREKTMRVWLRSPPRRPPSENAEPVCLSPALRG